VEPITFEVQPGITAIDTLFGGRERYTAAYLVHAEEPTLVETGPTTSLDHVVAGLDGLGIGPDDLAHIAVTHIHLDHAGGLGRLARRFPKATVWVHERGAPYVADPTKLVASAARIYGQEQMTSLFGPVDSVPSGRLRGLAHGDQLALGNRALAVVHTPGHAFHQVALVDSTTGAVFTGDALGIHVAGIPVLRPATPPPNFDVEQSLDSIERIRDRARSVLLFAHFGPIEEIDRVCDLAKQRIRGWADAVGNAIHRTDDLDEIESLLEREAARDVQTGAQAQIDLERFEFLSSIRMNAMGLIRYWKKRREREAQEAENPQGS
jgi:glyoxylase-like metal-dependent hydrolase (beta-lactamase superfamily II)